MNPVAVIQARMGSSRLPGKVLMDIEGQPMLARVVTRALASKQIDGCVVATSEEASDDPVASLCEARGWMCVRGSESNVLARFLDAMQATNGDPIVRLTADCPLLDAELIDRALDVYCETSADYVSYEWPKPTFPRGLDVEVIRGAALKRAGAEANDPADREHVTHFLYTHPEHFRLAGFANDTDLSSHRWTVDTAADMEFVRAVYGELGAREFGWRDVLALVEKHPDLRSLNAHVEQNTV